MAILLGCAASLGAAPAPAVAAATYQDPEALFALVSQELEPYVLVDVRSGPEYQAGHIPSAINVPVAQVTASPSLQDKGALIILYCASGMRAAAAKNALDNAGYSRVVDFGTVYRWTAELATGAEPGDCPCRESPQG
ncbi:MAG TPA: rhodanese-like domain-containing protein [bacterium]|nr:rhodanese-like domain-containing protein [bacterium]